MQRHRQPLGAPPTGAKLAPYEAWPQRTASSSSRRRHSPASASRTKGAPDDRKRRSAALATDPSKSHAHRQRPDATRPRPPVLDTPQQAADARPPEATEERTAIQPPPELRPGPRYAAR